MKKIVLLCFLSFGSLLWAQDQEQVLLKINDEPVMAEEFKRVFSKNLDLLDPEDRDAQSYLDLFIDYKLKLKEAYALQLDTLQSHRAEFDIYRMQLADKFMRNTTATEELVKEAYKRKQHVLEASHILLQWPKDATAKDSLEVFHRVTAIKKEIDEGLSFQAAALKYSDDPSVSENQGQLGWFGPFKMIYPFETAAYATPVGEVSEPVKTRFGYHLIHVTGKREAGGRVKVAHIMLTDKEGGQDAEQKIKAIAERIKQGASFSDMAKQYSEDTNTAANGGELKAFEKASLMSAKFEEAAFALSEENPISEPVKTEFGWHLIKLIFKQDLLPYSDMKDQLARQVQQDVRAQMIDADIIKKIDSTIEVEENPEALAFFTDFIDEDFFTIKDKSALSEKLPEDFVVKFPKETKTYANFFSYLVINQVKTPRNEFVKNQWVKQLLKNYIKLEKKRYYKEHLDEYNAEYAGIIEEYKNGLLLFDLMQQKVWEASNKDSLGLQQFYEQHAKDFKKPAQFKATIASGTDKKTLRNLRKAWSKNPEDASALRQRYRAQNLLFDQGRYSLKDKQIPSKLKAKPGSSKIYKHNGQYVWLWIEELKPAGIPPLAEIRGEVANAYQTQLEENWIAQLRAENNITINESVFEKLQEELE